MFLGRGRGGNLNLEERKKKMFQQAASLNDAQVEFLQATLTRLFPQTDDKWQPAIHYSSDLAGNLLPLLSWGDAASY